MANDIDQRLELSWLLAFYGRLLTDKQRQIISMHCDEDLSLAEIAAETGISRQGVYEQLSRGSARLMSFEEKLGVAARFKRMQDGLQQCLELLHSKEYVQTEALLQQLISL